MGAVAWGLWPSLRFPSPLIKPDVPISGIRLSDWLHRRLTAVGVDLMSCDDTSRLSLRLAIQLSLTGPDRSRCLQAHRQSPSPRHLRKHARSQGPFLRRHYPASTVLRPCPTPAWPPPVATLRPLPSPMTGLPRLPEPPFRRAVPTTPADQAGARVDCFPARAAFPKWPEGRHPHCHFRGLLRLHSRYGPPDRSAALATFVTRLQPMPLPARAARQLPDQSTTLRVEPSSTSQFAPSGRTAKCGSDRSQSGSPALRRLSTSCSISAGFFHGSWNIISRIVKSGFIFSTSKAAAFASATLPRRAKEPARTA